LSCVRCDGTGFEIVSENGHEYARPCACRRAGSEALAEDAFLAASRIPRRYELCALANFDPYTPSHRSALEKALRYCSGFPHTGADEGLGLLFTGGNGVGKTHLAVAVLRELVLGKAVRGQFWDFQELIREIKSSYDPETRTTELQVLEPVIECDVLLLDDLGGWRMTEWMHDTLFYLLNSRYVAKRPTLITTNFHDASPEEVRAAEPTVRREFFVERIGHRLRSRLMEMCLLVRIEGDDFRLSRQKANRMAVLGSSPDTGEAPKASRARSRTQA
jgi:DNA replication protein DnaC